MCTETKYECPLCDNGNVDLYVSGEFVTSMDCPDCNGTGKLSAEQHAILTDSVNEFNLALADEQYKY
jgi:ssDNA-binding Zn-finger/Zn-ribbon topoisomerase 1